MPNPLMPGPLNMARDIMKYTTNPHLEPVYNPITARDTIGQPIRDRVFERDTIGQPILGSYVTGRTTTGYPITTPVNDLTYRPIYNASNFSDRIFAESERRQKEESRIAMKQLDQELKRIDDFFKNLPSNKLRQSIF